MPGYDPSEGQRLSQWDHAAAGAFSGFVTRLVLQPLDVLKIRFQLQVEPLSKTTNSKYTGLSQAFVNILQEEGAAALWKGHVPAQMLSIAYGIVQFVSFEVLTEETWKLVPQSQARWWQPVHHFLCGSAAGAAATLVIQPMDVIRTRFIAQGNQKLYHSVVGASHRIVMEEGPRALYKGLMPTLLQIVPQTGFQFGFYKLFRSTWEYAAGDSDAMGVSKSLVCGSAAGVCAKVAVYPLDMVKKRLQVQGFEHGRIGFGQTQRYSGLRDCILRVMREEGVRGLYKGLSPSIIKAALSTALHFTAYDYSCRMIRKAR